jgi:Protein of unknown function (DUF1565)
MKVNAPRRRFALAVFVRPIIVLAFGAALLVVSTASATAVAGMSAADARGHLTALGSHEIFVDANAPSGGDGSATSPFRTISLALALAREIRAVSVEPISINVAAGSYVGHYPSKRRSSNVETLPLVLDVNVLTIRGPEEAGTEQQVKITAIPPLATDQAVVAVIADDVTIEHIAIDAGQTDLGALDRTFPTYGLYIDRARDFSVREVRITGAFGNGIFSRLASGEILNSEMTGSLVGSFIGAGSEDLGYPARVRYERNRLNCIGGAFFSTGTFPSRHPPFASAGGRVLPDAPIPPAPMLDLDLVGSEIVDNDPACNAAGVQFFLHVFDDGGQAGSMVARVENNTIARNGGHDLAVDSHLDPTPDGTCGTTAPAAFTGQFAGNVYSADRSKIFFGFAFRDPGESCYVTDSSIRISYPGDEMDGFSHYNPPGYRNILTVNDVPIED